MDYISLRRNLKSLYSIKSFDAPVSAGGRTDGMIVHPDNMGGFHFTCTLQYL